MDVRDGIFLKGRNLFFIILVWGGSSFVKMEVRVEIFDDCVYYCENVVFCFVNWLIFGVFWDLLFMFLKERLLVMNMIIFGFLLVELLRDW